MVAMTILWPAIQRELVGVCTSLGPVSVAGEMTSPPWRVALAVLQPPPEYAEVVALLAMAIEDRERFERLDAALVKNISSDEANRIFLILDQIMSEAEKNGTLMTGWHQTNEHCRARGLAPLSFEDYRVLTARVWFQKGMMIINAGLPQRGSA